MARIVLTSFGSYGDVNPYIGIALALRARGHAPVIATSPFYRDYVERAGIAFRPVRPDVDPGDAALLRRIMDPARGTEVIVRELLVPVVRDTLADLMAATADADALVSHPITFAAPIVAARRGVPWRSTVLAPMSFFSVHDLPVFPQAPALHTVAAVPPVARALVRLAQRAVRPWTGPVRALRREAGLPDDDPVFAGQHAPGGVLALFSRLLAAPQPDWPARVRITGHVFYNGPAVDERGAAALADFLEAGPAPLVFTLGSSAVTVAGDFYEASAQAARRLGRRAVLLAGPDGAARVRSSGEDLLVAGYARHEAVFPRAAAIIHHGGIGTLAQALRAGRPQLVVPWAHDQPDNAHRVARLGVARTLPVRRYAAATAASALERLLGTPGIERRAADAAAVVRSEGGAEWACDEIERALASA